MNGNNPLEYRARIARWAVHEQFSRGTLVQEMAEWQRWDEGAVIETKLQNIFDAFPSEQEPNESQTEDEFDLAHSQLSWDGTHTCGQQNLTPQGRDDVPDGLLFADDAHQGACQWFC